MEIATTHAGFAALELSAQTLASLEAKGYKAPTDVQAEAIPRALAGKDLVVQSRTGTGKTAAFGVPIVERIDLAKEGVQAAVLTPTRELALQVAEELSDLGRGRGIKVETIYGGDSMDRQLEGLRAGAQVVVGTPGRVLDLLRRRSMRFDGVKILVLDEADRMLDMGFAVEMGQIMEFMPAERQTLLFSATVPLGHPRPHLPLPDRARVGAALRGPDLREGGRAPLHPGLAPAQGGHPLQAHRVREPRVVHDLLQHPRGDPARLYLPRQARGCPRPCSPRTFPRRSARRCWLGFRSGDIRHLVTTDVASRGIDIADLSHVFIFSSPDSPEQYIHRAGRTGRVGKSGRAISLLSAHDLMNFNRVVKRYHVEVRELNVPSDEEVQERKVERIAARLAAEGQELPLEDYAEFSPIARRVAAHEQRDRIVALLLRKYFEAPPAEPEEEEIAPGPGAGAPSRPPRKGNSFDSRRRRRR